MSKKVLDQARDALRVGELEKARAVIAAYAENNELTLQFYMAKGMAELGLADWAGAAETFGAAAKRYHSNHEVWAYLGLAQLSLNLGHDSMRSFEKSLSINSSNGVAASNLANAYRLHGRFDEAEAMAHLGARTHPDKTWAMNMLGLVLCERGKFMEAEKVYEAAMALEPTNPHPALNLANMCAYRQQFDKAWPYFARARALADEKDGKKFKVEEALARIMASDFALGWELYEERLNHPNGGMHGRPKGKRFTGTEDIRGKSIAIVVEQGLGDNLHFCRFGNVLDKMGAELVWIVQPNFKRLFEDSFPGRVVTTKEEAPETDYYVQMLSMPIATGHILPDSWPKPPYFKARPEPVLPPSGRKGPRIGVIWAGSPGHARDWHRSMPLTALHPFFASVEGQFYAPFLNPALANIKDEPIIRLDHLIHDFADTAALMKQLDCVVTVDTSVAHLAGGLGLTTYLMVNFSSEWRWGVATDKTAWYPNMTIIRQKEQGDWDSVVQQLIPLFNNHRAPH